MSQLPVTSPLDGQGRQTFQRIQSQRVQSLFQASCLDMKPINDRLHSDSNYKKTSGSTFLLMHYNSPHFNRGHVDTQAPQIAPDISRPVGLVSASLVRSLSLLRTEAITLFHSESIGRS